MTIDQKIWLWFFRKSFELTLDIKKAKTDANKVINEWRKAKKNIV